MWEGTGKPELINLLELSPEMFQFIDRIVQRMESILGLNGAIRGQAPSDSGAALAMSSTLATQANADFQAKYASFLERVGSRIIATLKQYATAPRMIEIAGPGDTTYLQEFSNKNLTTVVKTVADIGNPISKTPQGKYQLAQLILQTGQATPSMVFEVIQSGRLEPITDTTEDEQIRILVENEMMEQGDYNAIAVLQTDNDVAHSQQHNAVIKRLVDKLGAAAAANDPRYKAAMGHLMQHVANFEDPNLAPIKQMLSLPTAQQQQQEAQQNPGKGGGPNQAQPGQAQPGGPQPKPAGQPGAPKGANAGPPALPGSGQQAPKNATGGGIVSGE
jgi:hypothetical protein